MLPREQRLRKNYFPKYLSVCAMWKSVFVCESKICFCMFFEEHLTSLAIVSRLARQGKLCKQCFGNHIFTFAGSFKSYCYNRNPDEKYWLKGIRYTRCWGVVQYIFGHETAVICYSKRNYESFIRGGIGRVILLAGQRFSLWTGPNFVIFRNFGT